MAYGCGRRREDGAKKRACDLKFGACDRAQTRWVEKGPLKLCLMFVRKIADFRPPKWPYPCPGIADFRSGKAEPCPGIVDLGLDRPKNFGGR